MNPSEMNDDEKMKLVAESPELRDAVGILIAMFHDLKLQSHIRLQYTISVEDRVEKYELLMIPLKNEINYQ